MKTSYLHLILLMTTLCANCAEVSRSFFDIQLSHPSENWRAAATTNKQEGTGELMLMKEGKGKVVYVVLEKKAPQAAAFDATELKTMQEQGASAGYKTINQVFTNFLGKRAYRTSAESSELRGKSVAYFLYQGDKRYRVLAVCFQGNEPESDEEIGSILKSMKLAK